jgi:hypothetical protein
MQKFDQALCDLGASVIIMPKVINDKLNHDSLVPTSIQAKGNKVVQPNKGFSRTKMEEFQNTQKEA